MPIDVNPVINYLAAQGMIKTWVELPDYNVCKTSQRAGSDYLRLTLAELHEIILSEHNTIHLLVRLWISTERLESDLIKMDSSLEELKKLTPYEALIKYGHQQYNEIIDNILNKKLHQAFQHDNGFVVNEADLEEKNGNDVEMGLVEMKETAQFNAGLSSNSGFFTPKQGDKTKRESHEEDTSSKKPRFG